MRKRTGLALAGARPRDLLIDEPGLVWIRVRTAFINQLFVDLNAQIDATFLIVTRHALRHAPCPDNIGLLYHRHLAMYGPADAAVVHEEPVVRQFLNAQRVVGPIRDVGKGRRPAGGRRT